VPFCLVGGRARVQGIGEILTPLPDQPRDFTLVVPPLSCSTPLVYRAWDGMGGPHDVHDDGSPVNDLQAAALVVEPRLIRWRDRIREAAGSVPMLAGSGATWFLPGNHPVLADALPDAHVVVTHTAP
jgi:4-diphosphocytidyl-2-C-methyl-D-erythritol kinase